MMMQSSSSFSVTSSWMLSLCLLLLAALNPASSFVLMPYDSRTSSSTLYMSLGSSSNIHKGTVKWFDTTKGFGFITRSDDQEDFFVHQSDIQAPGFRSLEDGIDVEFQIETSNNGKTKAICVTGPDGAALPRGYAYKKRDGDDE